jgi:pyridoxal 5'-phosphate synthase pdxT subunit
VTVGVLALQGDFALHEQALGRCGVAAVPIRRAAELDTVSGLVIPGGESTTLLRLLQAGQFVPAIERFHRAGKPIFGTCAGLILLAREVEQPRQFSLGLIDVTVERNAYGRQRESFSAPGTAVLDGQPTDVEMVFIRAPRVRRVGSGVASLARLGDEAVLVREGSVLGATFHPELTEDPTIHRYFCAMAA